MQQRVRDLIGWVLVAVAAVLILGYLSQDISDTNSARNPSWCLSHPDNLHCQSYDQTP